MEKLDIQHLIGSKKEQETYLRSHTIALNSVISSSFIDIGEKPDIICKSCLDLRCKDSIVVKKGRIDLYDWQRHAKASEIVLIKLINKYNLKVPKDRIRINLLTIKKAQELLG
jgi:hypothetical protein